MKTTTSLFLGALTLAASFNANSEVHTPHCLYGCPTIGNETNDVIVRRLYTVSTNDVTNLPDWVAYVVDSQNIGRTADRNWKADPILDPDERLDPNDYKGAYAALGTDRGHLAPLASFTSHERWETVNYLSNIVPQKANLNRGPWLALENAERDAANTLKTSIYVAAGPVFGSNPQQLPSSKETTYMPAAFWKVISVRGSDAVYYAAFVFPQSAPRKANHCDYMASLDSIAGALNAEFFHANDARPLKLSPQLVGCAQ